MKDLKAVGNLPGQGALYAVKLAVAAYNNLEKRTRATRDKDMAPLHADIPFWDIRGRDKDANQYVMIFTTDPWWLKKQYAGLCEIAGLRDKTVDDQED